MLVFPLPYYCTSLHEHEGYEISSSQAIIGAMITVIIAGGSGTRLWPLSTPHYPKHLLALTGRHALVYYAFERAKALASTVYVLTEASHAKAVQQQLPKLPASQFIIEPGRRGTANCIISALNVIKQRHDPDEPIAFLAADHYIRDNAGFIHSFKVAGSASKQTDRIVLIGVEPDYPATGFGYIEKGGIFDDQAYVFNVKTFKEKPPLQTAQRYLASGNYLWNCGYFVGSITTFERAMQHDAPNLFKRYQALGKIKTKTAFEKAYLALPTDSIDYALIEKVNNLLVVPAAFDWMDLGSFTDLQKAYGSNSQGNHLKGEHIELEGVENSFVHNQESKPVAVIGLDNVVVVNTPDGLLVARKDQAQRVGDVSKRFKGKP